MAKDKDNVYEVGYGKPPKATQFKSGQSGNPAGRPRGVRNFQTELQDVVNSKVSISQDGKRQSISVKRATIMRLVEKGLGGHVPAIKCLLELIQYYDQSDIDEAVESMSLDDADILEHFTQKIRNQNVASKDQEVNHEE